VDRIIEPNSLLYVRDQPGSDDETTCCDGHFDRLRRGGGVGGFGCDRPATGLDEGERRSDAADRRDPERRAFRPRRRPERPENLYQRGRENAGALPADIDARFAKFKDDATAALASIKDVDSFKANMPGIFKNCGGCHELYRAKLN
jgi:hypothetical protein